MGKGMTKTKRTLKKNTKKSRKNRKKQLSFRRGGETDEKANSTSDEQDKAASDEQDKAAPKKEEKAASKEVNKMSLTPEEKKEMAGFKQVIAVFLEKEKKSRTLKYDMNQENFEKYNNGNFENEREKYELCRDLTHLIIKDDAHNMFFDAKVASFQELIRDMYKYLTAFAGVDHDIKIDYYFKSLVNDKPFVRVTHNVNGYNTIHDVNNLLAYIKNEYTKKGNINKTHSEKTFIFHGNKLEDKNYI